MGPLYPLVRTAMKLLVTLSTLLALSLAEETKVVNAAPLTYDGYPYAGYGYAGYPYAGYPYAAHAVGTYAAHVAAPVAVASAPAVAPYVAPYAAPYNYGSQFHAQDEFGNLNSAKQEVGNTYGGVHGGSSYVDAAGVLQHVNYVADGAGFRVEDSRLPV